MKQPSNQTLVGGGLVSRLARRGLVACVAAFALGASVTSFATTISLNFIGRGDPTYLAGNEVAGIVPQKEWNNISSEPPYTGTAAGLTDSDGNFTDVTFSFAANDSWNSNGKSTTPDEKMMYGIMKQANGLVGGVATYKVDNLPDGAYDVVVYQATDADGAYIDTAIGSAVFYTICSHEFKGTYIQAKNTVNDDTLRDLGNYVLFTGVHPDGGEIVITTTYQGHGGNGIGTPGIQVIGSGSYGANTLPLNTLTDPKSVTVEVGPQGIGPVATFSVTADLPAHYQWYKNEVEIPGATGSSYTTPPTTTDDDGATFYCIARNNVNSIQSGNATITVKPTSNWLLNAHLDLAASQNQLNASPVAWTIVATNLLSGPNVDGASSAGFANDGTSDPDSPNGLWFKPFSGHTNDDVFGGDLINVHFYQDVPAIPGEAYSLAGHAKAEGNYCGLLENTPTKSVFALEFLNAQGDIIGSQVLDLQDQLTNAPNAWIAAAVSATAPAGTVTVRARASMINGFFSKDPQQSYFVDNFDLSCSIPAIRDQKLTTAGLTLTGTCGTPGANYNVLASDDITKPVSTWTKVGGGTFEETGTFVFTINPVDGPRKFFVIEVP
jgi:hypothetical protein